MKESSMFNCFNDYTGFTSILEGKLPYKLTMPDIKFHRSKSHNHHVKIFVNAMTLKGIDKDTILHYIPLDFQ